MADPKDPKDPKADEPTPPVEPSADEIAAADKIAAEIKYLELIGKSESALERITKHQDKLIEQTQEKIRLTTLAEADRVKELQHVEDIWNASYENNTLSRAEEDSLRERYNILKGTSKETAETLSLQYKKLVAQQELNILTRAEGDGVGGIAMKLLGVGKANDSIIFRMAKRQKLAKGLNVELKKSKVDWAAISVSMGEKLGEGFAAIATKAISMRKELIKLKVGFQRATNAGEGFADQINTDAGALMKLGVTQGESAKSLQDLYIGVSNFSEMNKESREGLNRFSLEMTRFGVDSKDTAEHIQTVTKTLGMTEEAAMTIGKEFESLSTKIGLPVNTLLTGFKKAMPQIAIFGEKAKKVFTDLAKASKATGVEVSQMLAITEKFDTFEGAAKSVGELNAILGTSYISSIDMVRETDPTKRLQMIQRTVESSGKSWAKMGYYMKKAVASAAGISDMETAERIFRAGSAGVEAYKKQQEEAVNWAKRKEKIERTNVDIAEKMQAMWLKASESLSWFGDFFEMIINLMTRFEGLLSVIGPMMAVLWAGAQMAVWLAGVKEAAVLLGLHTAATEANTGATWRSALALKGKAVAQAFANPWMAALGIAAGVAIIGALAYAFSSDDSEKPPGHARGVTNFEGGLSIVGEKGPELVNLPRGSNVITNENTNKLAGAMGGGGGSINYERLASAVASGVKSAMQATATDKPIIIELNDREFGRAVKSSLTKDSINSRVER